MSRKGLFCSLALASIVCVVFGASAASAATLPLYPLTISVVAPVPAKAGGATITYTLYITNRGTKPFAPFVILPINPAMELRSSSLQISSVWFGGWSSPAMYVGVLKPGQSRTATITYGSQVPYSFTDPDGSVHQGVNTLGVDLNPGFSLYDNLYKVQTYASAGLPPWQPQAGGK